MNDKFLRNFKFEVRAERNEEHGTYITGQPIVFGASTDIGGMYEEIIDEGALDGADLKDVRFLVNHNVNMIPLARSRNNNANSTMQLEKVQGGLNIRADLDTENNETSRSLSSAVSRGDISGMSFMFTVKRDEWEDLTSDYPKRHIKEIGRVFEVSAVTAPAYEQTSIEARSDAEALESAKAALESAKETEKRSALMLELNEKITRLRGKKNDN
ncbi:MAG: HK97 family phage prohead protease [Clostridia bacterium]|nr:HK97 family phage prohead protease [Clostridia bacterium]